MEESPEMDRILHREEAIEALDDEGEHKFLMDVISGPVYVVETSLEELKKEPEQPRLHEQIRESLLDKGLVKDPDKVVGGYFRVDRDEKELLYWGPSSYPVKAATPEESLQAVNKRGIKLINQWVGPKPPKS